MQRTWDEWVNHHSMLFALLSDGEDKMVRQWAVCLHLRGWTPDETWQASEQIAFRDPPSARAKHLAALESALPSIRQKIKASAEPPPKDLGTCVVCRGSGLVSVPNLRPDLLNRGRWYTYVVSCDCALGRWKHEHWPRQIGKRTIDPILSLAEYEAMNFDWQQQMRDRDEYIRGAAQAGKWARLLDETLGAIRKRQQNLPAQHN